MILCGSGTTGCHGWVTEHPAEARAVFLTISGSFVRGRYVGPDEAYRLYYNAEAWVDGDWKPVDLEFDVAPIPNGTWT